MTPEAFDWVHAHANRTPERTAVVDTATGDELTYEAFDERASRFADVLRNALEVDPGARVTILAHNGARYLEVLYGCAKAETLYVALNWRLAPPELEYVIDDASPDVLVYDPAFADAVEQLRSRIDVDHYISFGEPDHDDDRAYDAAMERASGDRIRMPDRERTDTWGLLYTSGTTGRPKGVRQTFDMVLYNALNIGIPTDLTARDTTLNVLPFFHTGGLNLYTNPTLIQGGTAIVQHSFDPGEALAILEDRATVFFGVPAVYRALYDHPTFAERDLSSVRSWASGGAPLPVSLLEAYADHDIVIRQGMGMTETGPTVTLIDRERALEKAGSIGQASPFVRTRIVEVDGSGDGDGDDGDTGNAGTAETVPPGETGELQVKGPGVTPGYWNRPDAQEEAFTDGWLHTGDVARRDEDGYLYIVDRLKNMFISGGENVYPAEIEHALDEHDGIAEAAVVPVPNDQWGEVGYAFVVPEPNVDLDEDGVLAFCRGRLAGYKVPKTVDLIDELPRNAAGKIERPTLEERAR
ncbi:AMP-binding protein [Natronosalvus vescus]|uniref:AMP-binding protein n=1 Tax=Natronosalvus vescus TaxID=2953881 RepID=UPI0020918EBD|nr:AMP-binding protein [Natronosalvus vescus]